MPPSWLEPRPTAELGLSGATLPRASEVAAGSAAPPSRAPPSHLLLLLQQVLPLGRAGALPLQPEAGGQLRCSERDPR